MAEQQMQDDQRDVLRELGIELPSVEALYTTQAQQPNNPFVPEVPSNLEDVGKVMVAGAIIMLEQAMTFYGITSAQGKSILQAVNKLLDVVPEEEVEKMKVLMSSSQNLAPPMSMSGGSQNLAPPMSMSGGIPPVPPSSGGLPPPPPPVSPPSSLF